MKTKMLFAVNILVILMVFATLSRADYGTGDRLPPTGTPFGVVAMSDPQGAPYQYVATPFTVTPAGGDTLDKVTFWGLCMGANSGSCIGATRLTVQILDRLDLNAVVCNGTIASASPTGRTYFDQVNGQDPTEVVRDMTTHFENEYTAAFNCGRLALGKTYYLMISGNVEPKYAWGWITAKDDGTSALQYQEKNTWSSSVWNASGGVNCQTGICFGGIFYHQDSLTVAYKMTAHMAPGASKSNISPSSPFPPPPKWDLKK